MQINGLRNPQNLWGRWVRVSRLKKIAIVASINALVLLSPLWQYWDYHDQQSQLTQQLQQQKAELTHQQRLFASLQSQQQISPTLARRLVPINDLIQKLAEEIHIEHSQWTLQAEPRLHLHIQGHFPKLRAVLTALLDRADLTLLSWKITQLDADKRNVQQSIQSEIWLQLQKEKE